MPPDLLAACASAPPHVHRGRLYIDANLKLPKGQTCHSRGSGCGEDLTPPGSLLYPARGHVQSEPRGWTYSSPPLLKPTTSHTTVTDVHGKEILYYARGGGASSH